jgi:hypothetical protein
MHCNNEHNFSCILISMTLVACIRAKGDEEMGLYMCYNNIIYGINHTVLTLNKYSTQIHVWNCPTVAFDY